VARPFQMTLAAAILAAAALVPLPVTAALIDLTDFALWGTVSGSTTVTRNVAGVGSVTVRAFKASVLTPMNLNNTQTFDGGGGAGAYGFCAAAGGPLACQRDGFGVAADDEVSISGQEPLEVRFATPVTLARFHFLDLFTGEPGTADPASETAAWRFGGTSTIYTLQGTSSHFGTGLSAGYANIAVANSGVTSVIFHATKPSNSDFALAAIEVVPLPAAALLFGTALAGLGWIRRRRQVGAPEIAADEWPYHHPCGFSPGTQTVRLPRRARAQGSSSTSQ
jgi:hypothetical protein